MKRVKAITGWYCTRCNHKIPDAQCSTLRVMRTGVCAHCANEYNGILGFSLQPGENAAVLTFEPMQEEETYRVFLKG